MRTEPEDESRTTHEDEKKAGVERKTSQDDGESEIQAAKMSGAQTPEDHLEDLVDLGAHPHRLRECLGAGWED